MSGHEKQHLASAPMWKISGGPVPLGRLVGIDDDCTGDLGLCACALCGQARVGEHWLAAREVGQ